MDIDLKKNISFSIDEMKSRRFIKRKEMEISNFTYSVEIINDTLLEMAKKLLWVNGIEINRTNLLKINRYVLDPTSPMAIYSIKDENMRIKMNELSLKKDILLVVEFF